MNTDSETDIDDAESHDDAVENVCDCVSGMIDGTSGIGWLKDHCLANISAGCVACLERELEGTQCSEGDWKEIALALVNCETICPNAITAPADEDQCREMSSLLETRERAREVFDKCLCVKCFEEYGSCLANPTCGSNFNCQIEMGNECLQGDCTQATEECNAFLSEMMFTGDDDLPIVLDVGDPLFDLFTELTLCLVEEGCMEVVLGL